MRHSFYSAVLWLAFVSSVQAADIRGVVEEQRKDCVVDGVCSLSIKTSDGQKITVVLNEGEKMPTCEVNQAAARIAGQLKEGQEAKINIPDQFRKSSSLFYLCGKDSSVVPLKQ